MGKRLLFFSSEKKWAEGSKDKTKAGPTRLLALFAPKSEVTIPDMQAAYPRAELTVERLPSP